MPNELIIKDKAATSARCCNLQNERLRQRTRKINQFDDPTTEFDITWLSPSIRKSQKDWPTEQGNRLSIRVAPEFR